MKQLFLLSTGLLVCFTATPLSSDKNRSEASDINILNKISYASGVSDTSFTDAMNFEIVNELFPYSPAIDPANYSINTSLPVGKTTGYLTIGSKASYNIPIEIPNGTNGLEPNISLNYISNFADGIMGIGWDLQGISSITRVNRTLYHDGQSNPISGTLADKFALNGNRLIAISGTYGAENSVYRTEIDEFSKVVSYGTTGKGPLWFKVYTKSGLICEFGNSTDSKIYNDKGCIISWQVNKISDRYNNYIKFNYSTLDDQRPISSIEYSGNSSLSLPPFAEVIFNYKSRSDTSSYCYGGKLFTRKILLDNIEVKSHGQLYKKYILSYVLDAYSQLQKITEYSSQNSELNPTVFTWTKQQDVFSQTTNYSGTASEIYFIGDFNGDGRDDLATVPSKTSYLVTDKWKMYLADANGTMVYASQGNLNTQFETFIVGDFNGDGLTDLMMQENYYQSDYPNEKKYIFYQSTGSSFDRKSYYYLCYNNDNLNIVDYNGDGELEFLYYDEYTNWYLYNYSGTSILNTSFPIGGSIYIQDEGIPNEIADFNGDGCSDLLQLWPDGYKIFEFKGSLTGTFVIETYQGMNLNENDLRLLGDFNGDGCTDIIRKSSTGWSLLVLTSYGFQESELNCFNNFNIIKTNNRFFAQDMNGDGKDDVVIVGKGQNTSNSYSRINVAISSGNSFSINEYVSSTSMSDNSDSNFHFGDFNGDGRSQLLYGNSPPKLFSFAGGTPSHLINTIIDGLGAKTTLTYLPMSNSSVYTRGTNGNYQLKDYSSSMQLVYQVQSDNGLGTTNTISYHFAGAKMHKRGKGLVGFSKITAINDATNITSERNYTFDGTFFYQQLATIFNKQGSTILSSVTNTWSKINNLNKYCFPFISATTQTDNLTGLSSSSTATYDSYGNPTLISHNYGNGHTQTLTYNYTDERISDWLIGRPTTITETSVKDGITSTFLTTRTYLSTCNMPDVDIYNSGDASMWQYNRDYDSFGNLWKEHITTTGLGESLSIYEYDDNGVNLTKLTDPLGNETIFTWYPSNGLQHTQTDPFGNETTYTYNSADQLSSISSTNQITRTVTSGMEFADGPANALYYIQVTGDDGSLAKTWYNKLGQGIRSEAKGFNGTMTKVDRQYNIKGQLFRVSEPSTGSPSQWNVIEYDNYGRITSNDPYYGPASSFSYSGATFTRTSNNRAFASTISASGLVTSCSDPGGNILYDYYPEGLAKSVQAPGGAVTSFTYDKNGNRLTITDPSAGTITNTYYGTGQLKATQNARGQSTTYYYQTNGLLDYYTTVEGTTDYSYNSSGQISNISSPGGVIRSFTYDAHGRVSTVAESIGTVVNTVSFTYDNKSRLYRKYFNGTTDYEQFDYNSNGYLYSIGFNGVTVWQINTMDEYFRIRQATIGTTPCLWSYNSNNMLSQINATGVQQYNYSFDVNTGNLNSRTNYLKNLTESYTYDTSGLDRLTGVAGPQNMSITYGSNGNILSKSDAGTYSYSDTYYSVTGISDGLNINSAQQSIEYYSFEKVKKITQGTKTAEFTYNAENQRIFMVIKDNGAVTKSRWYLGGDYEREETNGVVSQYIWIGGDPYSAVAVAKKDGNGTWVVYNIFRDHLGTITHLKSVNGIYEYSFDAWGRRRDKDTWNYTLDNEPVLFADRGFTAHEFLTDFNLYNMNGRLYDPVTARFLSPDIYVQSPDFTQSYNRYSYCFNNPLSYVDPSGYDNDDPCKTGNTKHPPTWWDNLKRRLQQIHWIRSDNEPRSTGGVTISLYGGDGNYGRSISSSLGPGGGGGSSSIGNVGNSVHGPNAGFPQSPYGEFRSISIVVGNSTIGTAITWSYPYDNGNRYIIPTYQMTVTGIDASGNTISKNFEVIRFGVNGSIDGSVKMVGLADHQTYSIKGWNPSYKVHSFPSPEDGAWIVNGNYLIHDGPDDPMNQYYATAGCIEICGGPNGFVSFNNFLLQLSGAGSLSILGQSGLLSITYLRAEKPQILIYKP